MICSWRPKKNVKQPTPKKAKGLSRAEKIAIPIIIIIAIWTAYSFTQPSHPGSNIQVTYSSTGSISQSSAAPDFTLPVVSSNGLTGQTVTLSSFRGKVVLLEFMEPWCPHCQNMAPVLEGLYNQYGSKNVTFISVAGSWQGATANDQANFIKSYGTTWVNVYDSSGSVFSTYNVQETPTFFIIGKDGSISSPPMVGEEPAPTISGYIAAASVAKQS